MGCLVCAEIRTASFPKEVTFELRQEVWLCREELQGVMSSGGGNICAKAL